ncbi:PAS domain S-box-containing protein [Variovorax boronicumulans]|uniref:histidine kinase n=1 Tax=Variovorax boronicumulans TaxID=436515 RepID=A0AAW8CW77_9BURK|nr:ATP-binding protein [Variovorax boronicumulans]MDP9891881.1 PAS domain S-box-containing protein [Variovorax boronicumulans]MDQ0053054.1 PAS domain S-box-containing protein [Variovorax boronicumulans]
MKSADRLRRRIVAAGVLLIAACIGSAGYDGWRLHQQIMLANERELGNLAKALAEQSLRSMQAVDVVLRDTASWYGASSSDFGPGEVSPGLASRTVGVPQVSVLTVVDAHGMQRHRSRDTGGPLSDVSDRPYFTAQRDSRDTGLFISEPMTTRTEGMPGLVVSRRIDGPNGAFAGVVTAIVTLQHLEGMYSAIQLGDRSSLLLTLSDGTLVVRQPGPTDPAKKLSFPELAALKEGGKVARAVNPMDGRAKLIAAVGVGKRPLILAVMRDEEEALWPWYDEMWSSGIRTVLLILLVVLTIVGLLRQLRRQERGELALRQSEERYAMAMEAANEGHAEWNVAQDSVFVSDKWRALHGVDASAPLATSADVLRHVHLHPDDAPHAKAAIDDHLAGRTHAVELEYRVRHAGGDWRWIHARGRCVRDETGAALRLFGAATDVSDRKLAEADKARLEARLQQTQRLEALGTLSGGIAHDFNNILGAILGFGEMAQQQAEAGSAMRRHIDRVMQAGARARLLVRRILDFSRSGIAERVPVNMQALVEEVISMLVPTLPPGLRVDARLQSGSAAVVGDGTQLYQVVMNLCTNAVQAMGKVSEVGVVSLRLDRVDIAEKRALLHGDIAAGSYVRLDVGDTGPGISPEVLQRMFDPFFTTKKVGEGTGLGLSVVHGIVADIGGAIDVATGNGRPTVVSVWLPVLQGQAAEGGPAQAPLDTVPGCPRGNGEVVMIVDDEQPLLELAEELLASLGYEPVGFGTSERALAAFEADPRRFDAVLTDEMLPGMPGSELARLLRSKRPELPVALVSGNVNVALEQRARDAGVAEVLHKPLGLQELAECLARLLAARRPD